MTKFIMHGCNGFNLGYLFAYILLVHRRVCLEELRIIYQIWFMNMVKEFIHINQIIHHDSGFKGGDFPGFSGTFWQKREPFESG